MDTPTTFTLTEATHHSTSPEGTCGCGEGIGGSPELDVRAVPHAIRHASVLGAWSAIPHGSSLVLVAPHDPKPLLAQLAALGPITVTYLDEGPDAWRLRITRG